MHYNLEHNKYLKHKSANMYNKILDHIILIVKFEIKYKMVESSLFLTCPQTLQSLLSFSSSSHSSPSSFCIRLKITRCDKPKWRLKSDTSRPMKVHFGHLYGFRRGKSFITSSRKCPRRWTLLSLALLTLVLNSSPHNSQLWDKFNEGLENFYVLGIHVDNAKMD